VLIRSLADPKDRNRPGFHGIIRGVRALGFAETPAWRRSENGLEIAADTVKSGLPVVFEIEVV